MDRNEIRELYGNIDACSYVTKGESDTREIHAKFKIVCGANLEILHNEFEKYAEIASAKYAEIVDPKYAEFVDKAEKVSQLKDAEKRTERLQVKYADAIASAIEFDRWRDEEFYLEEVTVPELKKWPFADLPEKIAGGYILALKEMIGDFPEID